MDASVSVKTAETAEMDEGEMPARALVALSLSREGIGRC
jgi:hypothetical protein